MLLFDMLFKLLNIVIEGYNDKIVVNMSGFELGKVKVSKLKVRCRLLCGFVGVVV